MKNEINKIGKDVIDLQIKALRRLKNSINDSFEEAVKALKKCKSKVIICGVGKSGIGRYQGRFGFEEFSHIRPIIKNIDPSPLKMLHPPYQDRVQKMVKILKKWL